MSSSTEILCNFESHAACPIHKALAPFVERNRNSGKGANTFALRYSRVVESMNRKEATYGADGYNTENRDIYGYNRAGWNTEPTSCDLDQWRRDNGSKRALSVLPLNLHTGTVYDSDGYNIFGYDQDRYDRTGWGFWGDFNQGDVDREGYDRKGWFIGREGDNGSYGVWNRQSIHRETGTLYSPAGYDRQGNDADGFTRQGFHSVTGLDTEGYDCDGYDFQGFNRSLWNADGFHLLTGTRYSPEGLTRTGLNVEGYDRSGYDLFGTPKDEKTAAVHYRLQNWNHLVLPSKVMKDTNHSRDFEAEGWSRVGGQGWVVEAAALDLQYAYTHDVTGTELNPEGFSVIGVNAENISETGFNLNSFIHEATGTIYGLDGFNWNRTVMDIAAL